MDIKDLYKKYNVKRLSWDLSESGEPVYRSIELSEPLALELAKNTSETGRTNTHFVDDLPDVQSPFGYKARGVRGRPGAYWDVYDEDGLVMSSIDSVHEGLVSGQWEFQVPKDADEALLDRLSEQVEFLNRTLLGRPSTWKTFLKNWTHAHLIYGFGLWEIVDTEEGGIRRLAWRDPSTVEGWIFDDPPRELQGVKFKYADGTDAEIAAKHILLYSTGTGPADPEGRSPVRRVVRWVELKQLVSQIEAASAEAHGTGFVIVTDDGEEGYDDSDAEDIITHLNAAGATDIAKIRLKSGFGIEWLSPKGHLPDFQAIKDYCDKQITLTLQNTGSMVGLDGHGNRALAETKDVQENVRRVSMAGQHVCDLINEFIVPRVLENAFDGPIEQFVTPKLSFSLQKESRDPEHYQTLTRLADSGLLSWRRSDENQLREELDLAPLPDVEETEEDDIADDQLVYKISNALQNGAAVLTPELVAYVHERLGAPPPTEEEASAFVERHREQLEEGESPAPETPEQGGPSNGDFSHGTACGHHEALSLGSDPEAVEYAEGGIYLTNGFDPDRMNDWLDQSNNEIGRVLRSAAADFRDEYVRLTAGVSDPSRITEIGERLRRKHLKRFADEIRGEVYRVAVKGSAATLRELGALAPEQGELPLPQVPKDPDAAVRKYSLKSFAPEFDKWADLVADRIARKAYNITESMLDANAVPELSPNAPERAKPPIPTVNNFSSYANDFTSRAFQGGREAIVEVVRQEAERRGLSDTRVVAEYSSVMERETTCQPCRNADGTRVFVGSKRYDRISPPNLCEGDDRCRCIWFYIMPSERGYEDIINDLNAQSGTDLTQSEPHADILFVSNALQSFATGRGTPDE